MNTDQILMDANDRLDRMERTIERVYRRNGMVKILWPDGPRYESEEYVIDAAFDQLCNEWIDEHPEHPDDEPIPVEKPDLLEAVEIVNDRGVLTTAKLR